MTATPAKLTVPAHPEYARLLRAVADAVAAGTDLPTDTIDDLELAVTEAAGALLVDGSAGRLALEITGDGTTMRCSLVATGEIAPMVRLDPVRSMVLDAITDWYEVDPTKGAVTFTVSPG